ncbi:MAG: hypothetical protein ACRDJ4_03100 [Actinomycetota bacterium]
MHSVVLAVDGGWGWDKWMFLAAPLGFYSVVVLALLGGGRTDERNPIKFFFAQISDSLHRLTGIPGWAMAGALSGLLMLLIGVIGFYWDVAWHIDFGRDKELFTPAHVMILFGLGGLIYAAGIATLFATIDRADVGFSILGLRIPWSALTLGFMGAGAVAAFPLDNLWHAAYGLDITLWSPTHLQLVLGGSLGTLAIMLMIAEALPGSRPTVMGKVVMILAAGAALTGMSTVQGEFDYRVPQFQVLYLPILIAAAAGFTLTFTRIALGRGGALWAVGFYLVLRLSMVWAVAGGLNHTVPHFPLYLASALIVEGVAAVIGTDRRLRFALASGLLVGSVGLALELPWVSFFYQAPPVPALLPKVALLGPITAIAAAILGTGLARAFSQGEERIPVGGLALAGVVLLAAFAYPLPRREGNVQAVVRLQRAGDMARVDVQLDPPDAARNAIVFGIGSWQGGGTVRSSLKEVGPGHYVSTGLLPVTGRWKTLIGLNRGDEVMAAPVYMPADPEISATAVPAVPERRVTFVRNTKLLLREAHDGPGWPAAVVYTGWATFTAIWVGLLAFTATRIDTSGRRQDAVPPQPFIPTPVGVGAPAEWSPGGWHASSDWHAPNAG